MNGNIRIFSAMVTFRNKKRASCPTLSSMHPRMHTPISICNIPLATKKCKHYTYFFGSVFMMNSAMGERQMLLYCIFHLADFHAFVIK